MENEKSKYVPPIPGKGHNISNSRSEDSPSHYDILPQRESLPIKQRHNIGQGIADMQLEAAKNPEYDVLPLKTFHNTPHSEVSNTNVYIIYMCIIILCNIKLINEICLY